MKQIQKGIWLTGPLLTADECARIIAATEAFGFRQAAQRELSRRNNFETFIRDNDLGKRVFARLHKQMTAAQGVPFKPVGITRVLQCYRYGPGNSIGMHQDRPETFGERASDLTIVLYLSEGFDGGETGFSARNDAPALKLKAPLGCAVLFRHDLRHEGCEVLSGTKYIARASVAVDPPMGLGFRNPPQERGAPPPTGAHNPNQTWDDVNARVTMPGAATEAVA